MILKEIEIFEGIDFEVMNEIAGICSEENYSKGSLPGNQKWRLYNLQPHRAG
jgi:hypothetical protein